MNVYDEIVAERNRQDAKWGGPTHDDHHEPLEWVDLIKSRADDTPTGSELAHSTPAQVYRKRLIQIAALAVAAVESWDRELGAMSDA